MRKKIKILFIFIFIFFVVGCSSMNSKTKQVEMFLNRYQMIDDSVMNEIINTDISIGKMNKKQRLEYLALIKKQYQNMSYKIIDIKEDNNRATANIEIEVYDYKSSLDNANRYYKKNHDKFKDEDSFMDYKIKELKKVADRKKEYITLNLYKDDNIWKVEKFRRNDLEKIYGLV